MSFRNIGCIVLTAVFTIGFFGPLAAATNQSESEGSSKLLIVWTSGDKDVALKMVHMYALNSKKREWWDSVRLLIWGPSQKLVAEDKDIQDSIKAMSDAGVEFYACKACADLYGVAEKLAAQGVTVKYTGEDLSEWLRSDWTTITF